MAPRLEVTTALPFSHLRLFVLIFPVVRFLALCYQEFTFNRGSSFHSTSSVLRLSSCIPPEVLSTSLDLVPSFAIEQAKMRYQTLRFTMFYKEPRDENKKSSVPSLTTNGKVNASQSGDLSPTTTMSLLSRRPQSTSCQSLHGLRSSGSSVRST